MSISLDDVIRFEEFMQTFQAVRREVRTSGRPEKENDVEHSYQLAMMAWYLNDAGTLQLDVSKLIQYALIHDIPEAYAGDVHIFDVEGRKRKAQREAESIERITGEFEDFPQLVIWIHDYEAQTNAESQFVYALDKFMPMLVIYLEGGSSWRELGYDLDGVMANKREKIRGIQIVRDLLEELEPRIRQQPELFPKLNN